jgi:hypothetical protein
LELELPLLELLDLEQVSDLSLGPSSSGTPGTPALSNSFSPTPFLVSIRFVIKISIIVVFLISGFALSEAMGLFCLMMAFLLLFAF